MKRFKKILKRIGLIILVIIILILSIPISVSVFNLTPNYTRKFTNAGFPINSSRYIQLQDSSYVWISIWIPENLNKDQKIPTLIETSRYAEHFEMGWLYKSMQLFGEDDFSYKSVKKYLENGYAFVWVQSPGSCQSTGVRNIEYPPEEIEAMSKTIDWIISQEWSNKKVGAIGGSYSGTTADMCCATMHPALKVVAPKAPDFDSYQVNAQPGGLMSKDFISIWANMTYQMDQNNVIEAVEAAEGELSLIDKLLTKAYIKSLKKPGKKDIDIFNKAISDHKKNLKPSELMKLLEFKDQKDINRSNLSVGDIALYNYKNQIEKAKVNTYTQTGWLDAGVTEGALQKYLTINSPQILKIYPAGHILSKLSDPYDSTKQYTKEQKEEQKLEYWSFLDKHLKSNGEEEKRRIQYFTYGINEWQETSTWPPQNATKTKWYLGNNKRLATKLPTHQDGYDTYKVDFRATTGSKNRWITQMGKPVVYNDRRIEDEKLLTYTSLPLEHDIEVTGSPTITLYVSSTHTDGAFHIYLEDLSPTGEVFYLSEGLLRAIHRKEIPKEEAPYIPLGVYHSFNQADTSALIPGQITEIKITLYPISTVFKKGHSIRVAIAGHDAAMQSKYPQNGTPILRLQTNAEHPSNIVLPMIKK